MSKAIAGAAGMMGLQLAMTYVPLLNRLLHTAPLPADSWLWIGVVEKSLRLRPGQ